MEFKREKIKEKISKLENKLEKEKERLNKITPIKPLVDEDKIWNNKTRTLDYSYKYHCSYCGEQIRRGIKKHKCGYLIDWTEISK